MTKHILPALILLVLATSVAFSSCKDKSKVNLTPSDSLLNDSVSKLTTDTSIINHTTLTDSSWDKAAE
jgi:hypothetical protein